MRRLIFTFIAIFLTLSLFSQNKYKTGKTGPWKKGGFLALNLGQSGSRNWAGGNEKFSLSFAGYLSLWAVRHAGKNIWDNSFDFGYAMVNTHSGGVHKVDDKIDIVSKYTHDITRHLGVGTWGNLRSQFTNGWDYTEEKRRRISGFFAPAYLTFGPGIDLHTSHSFSIFISPISARWVIVANRPYSFNYQGGVKPDSSNERSLASYYNVNPERKVRFDVAAVVSMKFQKEICHNVMYKTRLDIVSEYSNNPGNIDWYWTNSIGMKVNKWLQVNYNFDLAYDDDVRLFGVNKTSPALQLRSLLGVGVAAKF
jgi:hypothetical protein